MLAQLLADLEYLGIESEVLSWGVNGSRVGRGLLHADVASHGRPWCPQLQGEIAALGVREVEAYGARIALSELRGVEACSCWLRDRNSATGIVSGVSEIAHRLRLGREGQMTRSGSPALRGVLAWSARSPWARVGQARILDPGLVAVLEARSAELTAMPLRSDQREERVVVLERGEVHLATVVSAWLGGSETAEALLARLGPGDVVLGEAVLVGCERSELTGLVHDAAAVGLATEIHESARGVRSVACGLWEEDPSLGIEGAVALARAVLCEA